MNAAEAVRYKDRIYIACDFVQGLDLADWLTDQQATTRRMMRRFTEATR
jgi:hypothetical protein